MTTSPTASALTGAVPIAMSVAPLRRIRPWIATICVAMTVITSATAAADDSLPPIVIGKMLLDLRGPDAFVYGDVTEPLATVSQKNRVLVSTGKTLAVIGPAGQSAFLDKQGKEWIGINSNGLFAGRNQNIDPPLTIALVDGGATPPAWSEIRVLQFNTKHNAVFNISLSVDGAAGSTYTVFSGLSVNDGAYDPANPRHLTCAEGSDSGPDSDAVNCTIGPLVEVADTATFTTLSGDWSLGGENSVSEFVFIQAPTGVIGCGDSTVAVGNGIDLPFGQCTRLDNTASTLPGGPGADNCQVVNYSLEATNCTDGNCDITLLYGLSGTQDATQFRFLCTANWVAEPIEFDGAQSSLPPAKTKQYWGLQNVLSTRELDYCPGSTVETDPVNCEPGTVAVTSNEITFPTPDSIMVAEGGLDAFQTGDVINVAGTLNDGIYTVVSASALSLSVQPSLSASATEESGSITRLSGCPIVGFNFSGIPFQDMAPTEPGDQRGCLLDERVTQCNSQGDPAQCLQQTWGWEGDARVSRF